MTGRPAGLHCPGCETEACMILSGRQALCGNDGCAILIWDPTLSPAQNMASMHRIDLSGWWGE